MNVRTSIHTKAILTGILATAVAAAAWAAPRSETRGSFDRTLKVAEPASVDVRTGSGNIHVKQGDSSSVVIHAEIRSGHGDWGGDSNAEQRIREIEKNPPIEQDGNTVRIGHTHDSDLYRNISISYEIRVPAQTRLDASTGSGDFTATGVQLEISGHTGSGNIRVRGIKGAMRASTGSGDVEASGEQHGDWHLRTGSGNVTVELPKGAGFELDAHSGSGSIQTDREIVVQGTLSHRDIHGRAGSGGPLLELRTSSGSIYLR